MQFFIDTADIEEIRTALGWGLVDGVTTNPSLVAKTGRTFEEVIKDITELVDGPISLEVTALDAEGMVTQARELVKYGENVVIKIPLILDGLQAVRTLSPGRNQNQRNAVLLSRSGAACRQSRSYLHFAFRRTPRRYQQRRYGIDRTDHPDLRQLRLRHSSPRCQHPKSGTRIGLRADGRSRFDDPLQCHETTGQASPDGHRPEQIHERLGKSAQIIPRSRNVRLMDGLY